MWRLRQGTPSADYSPLPVSRLTIPTLASHIDGAGLAKLETLGQAVTLVQRLNSIVERMAQSQKMMQPLAQYRQQIQRAAAPLASLLKAQFEPIADKIRVVFEFIP